MMRERDQALDLPIKTSRNYTQARNCTAALQTKPYNPIQGQTARNLYSVQCYNGRTKPRENSSNDLSADNFIRARHAWSQ